MYFSFFRLSTTTNRSNQFWKNCKCYKNIIENTDAINQIANWLNELSLDEIFFSENEIPTDVEGGERYSFTVYELEESNIHFDYIINDTEDCYIQYNTKWYIAKNPISPTFINR